MMKTQTQRFILTKAATLLALIPLSAAQSSVQTHIHNAILVIDTSNNASYNQVHWLVGMPYLSIKARFLEQNGIGPTPSFCTWVIYLWELESIVLN